MLSTVSIFLKISHLIWMRIMKPLSGFRICGNGMNITARVTGKVVNFYDLSDHLKDSLDETDKLLKKATGNYLKKF